MKLNTPIAAITIWAIHRGWAHTATSGFSVFGQNDKGHIPINLCKKSVCKVSVSSFSITDNPRLKRFISAILFGSAVSALSAATTESANSLEAETQTSVLQDRTWQYPQITENSLPESTDSEPLSDSLTIQVPYIRYEERSIQNAFYSLGRTFNRTIVVESDIEGEITIELNNTTLRGALFALTEPNNLYFEENSDFISVKKNKIVLYVIDYPQITRNGTGNSSVTLGSNFSGGSNRNLNTLNTLASQTEGGNASSDNTTISISQENENSFWTNLKGELESMLEKGESLIVNRFSGIVQVTAPVRRHEEKIQPFIDLVNKRISQQVIIEAKILEVEISEENRLGIDWELAASSIGQGSFTDTAASLVPNAVGPFSFPPNTFTTTINYQNLSATIQALQEQGNVRTVSQPNLRALNNQTAYIKVGVDRPFFSIESATTLSQGGNDNIFTNTQETFSQRTITIGTVLVVTPHVSTDGTITLDVLPALTRLQGVETSPDERQTAPITEVKQASTIVRMTEGQTAIIGGLISDSEGYTTRKIPWIGDLPILGRAFRSTATATTRSELVIFLTPHLVH